MPAPDEVDSNVITLPTLEVALSSPAVGKPDNPVMDDAALGTVESSLFPTMGTIVAGGVLLSAPKELSNDDIGSTRRLEECSFDVDRVGGGGEAATAGAVTTGTEPC